MKHFLGNILPVKVERVIKGYHPPFTLSLNTPAGLKPPHAAHLKSYFSQSADSCHAWHFSASRPNENAAMFSLGQECFPGRLATHQSPRPLRIHQEHRPDRHERDHWYLTPETLSKK